jgi:putative acetyltransferase
VTDARRPGLRPYLPADTPVLEAIFVASIDDLTSDDYSRPQQEAWIAQVDEDTLAKRLGAQLTLVATMADAPVGFASLKDNKVIDMLYVYPAVARQGVATALVDALEKLAAARGSDALTVDASDTARPFFTKRGYSDEIRKTVPIGDEWLGNTTMKKSLLAAPHEAPQGSRKGPLQ